MFSELNGKGSFFVIVRPNSKDYFAEWVEDRQVLLVSVKEKAEDNRANSALVKYLSRVFGRDIKIVSGARSKKKLVRFV